MLDAHAYVMQVKLCKANTRGVTRRMRRKPIPISWARLTPSLQDRASWSHGPRCSQGVWRLEPLSFIGIGRGQVEFRALPHPWFLTASEDAYPVCDLIPYERLYSSYFCRGLLFELCERTWNHCNE